MTEREQELRDYIKQSLLPLSWLRDKVKPERPYPYTWRQLDDFFRQELGVMHPRVELPQSEAEIAIAWDEVDQLEKGGWIAIEGRPTPEPPEMLQFDEVAP